MSEKMELADELNMCAPGTYVLIDVKLRDEIVAALRASSPAQETVTTEPVEQDGPCFYCGEITSSFAGNPGMWPLIFAQPDGTGIARIHHARCVTDRLDIPAPPQPGPEEIAEHLYTKFCADPSIEWQDASEKLKDVWRRYAVEIVALPGENSK